jgi:hypothetical protein
MIRVITFVVLILIIPNNLFDCDAKTLNQDSLFYIYDWGENITNSWPRYAAETNKDFSITFYDNHGVGPLVNASKGLYKTFQYGNSPFRKLAEHNHSVNNAVVVVGLFRLFNLRLISHKQRTLDPAKAISFFVRGQIYVIARFP